MGESNCHSYNYYLNCLEKLEYELENFNKIFEQELKERDLFK